MKNFSNIKDVQVFQGTRCLSCLHQGMLSLDDSDSKIVHEAAGTASVCPIILIHRMNVIMQTKATGTNVVMSEVSDMFVDECGRCLFFTELF